MCCFLWDICVSLGFSLLFLDSFRRNCIDDCLHAFLTPLGSTGRRQANQKTKYESIETWGRTQHKSQHIKTNQLVSTCWFFYTPSFFFCFFLSGWVVIMSVYNHNLEALAGKVHLIHKTWENPTCTQNRCFDWNISSLWSCFVKYLIYFDVHYYSVVVVKYFYMCCLY